MPYTKRQTMQAEVQTSIRVLRPKKFKKPAATTTAAQFTPIIRAVAWLAPRPVPEKMVEE